MFVKEARCDDGQPCTPCSLMQLLAYSTSAVQKYIPLLSQHIYTIPEVVYMLTKEWYMHEQGKSQDKELNCELNFKLDFKLDCELD